MGKLIYLDYQATTPVAPEVLEAMLPYFSEHFGNAASKSHVFGWKAEAAVEVAREQIAQAVSAKPEEIIFTSGATEANNLALLGLARAQKTKKSHLITVQTEHKSILDPCKQLEKEGFELTYLPVNASGELDLNRLQDSIKKDTLLISIMAANNEIGTIFPLQMIGQIAKESGVFFHSDGAQAVGKIPLNVKKMNLDFLSLSAHKFYGPKGIGALYIKDLPRQRHFLQAIQFGGGHEHGLRSGTLNVPAIVGMGAALPLAESRRDSENSRLAKLRERLWKGLQKKLAEVVLNGSADFSLNKRLAHNLNCRFPNINAQALIRELREVAVSSGSACSSANPEPSHILLSLGLNKEEAASSLRFSLGAFTTEEDIDLVLERIVRAIEKLRSI